MFRTRPCAAPTSEVIISQDPRKAPGTLQEELVTSVETFLLRVPPELCDALESFALIRDQHEGWIESEVSQQE